MKKVISNKYFHFFIILLFSIVIVYPLFKMQLGNYNEFRIHIGRIIHIRETIEQGIFPPLLNDKNMNGFGYALNIFYGPLTTYVPILISYICGSVIISIKIFTFLTVFLSGITMYNFLKHVSKNGIVSLVGAIIYIISPYKLTNIFSRNALGEYTAFIFIPMIFEGLYSLIQNEDKKKNGLLIIGASGLILSHTITTIYVSIFALIYCGFNYKKIINKTFFKYIIIDLAIVMLITSFYTIPLLEHKFDGNYAIFDKETMASDGRYVTNNTNNVWDWFESELSKEKELIFSFGLVTLFLIGSTIYCYNKVDKDKKEIYKQFLIISGIALLLCTKLFPWSLMPQILTIIQFAWRMNGFFIFFMALVCGINAYIIAEMYNESKYVFISIILVSAILLVWFRGTNYIGDYNYDDEIKYETNIFEAKKLGPYNINRDYMPLRALNNIDYLENRAETAIVLDGKAEMSDESKNGFNYFLNLSDVKDATIELPYLYYHGYTITLNEAKIDYMQDDNGFIIVKVNNDGTLRVKYTGTFIEKAGHGISIFGVITLIAYIIYENKKEKR